MAKTIVIEIPDEVLLGMKIPEKDLEKVVKVELAILFYEKGYLTFGQARKLSGLSKWEFIEELAKRGVKRHYSEENLKDDLRFSSE